MTTPADLPLSRADRLPPGGKPPGLKGIALLVAQHDLNCHCAGHSYLLWSLKRRPTCRSGLNFPSAKDFIDFVQQDVVVRPIGSVAPKEPVPRLSQSNVLNDTTQRRQERLRGCPHRVHDVSLEARTMSMTSRSADCLGRTRHRSRGDLRRPADYHPTSARVFGGSEFG